MSAKPAKRITFQGGTLLAIERLMKTTYPLLIAASLIYPALGQSVPPVIVEKTVTETVSPGTRVVEETIIEKSVAPAGFDPRRQLSIVPRVLPALPVTPATTTETIETTTRIGSRTYNTERSVVVVEGRELPYVTVPVLFVKETAELLDAESRIALEQTATAILEVTKSDPSAVFDIEGHTSTDGTDELNMTLSAARALRVHEELTKRYFVPASVLSAHGYGESHPMYPNGDESQMTLDRRVLVVRVK
jgi:outer membrane protein OmpA-like peptidoglycan-associated protein